MSSMLTSQGMVLATAMALSGTILLLSAFRLQKSPQFSTFHHPIEPHSSPVRPCISTDGKKTKKKKRVQFAEDVVEPSGNSEEYRKKMHFRHGHELEASSHSKKRGKVEEMPANRMALYNSMLKGRVIHRVTYSY